MEQMYTHGNLVFQDKEIEIVAWTTSNRYPLIMLETDEFLSPPKTELLNEIACSLFESDDWVTRGGTDIKEIHLPQIFERWILYLRFYDKDGKLVCGDPQTDAERKTAGGFLEMERRLQRECRKIFWLICAPQMPVAEPFLR